MENEKQEGKRMTPRRNSSSSFQQTFAEVLPNEKTKELSEQEPTAGRKRTDQERVRVIILHMVNGGEEVLELVWGEVSMGDVSSAKQHHCSP